jgi:PmbA protein
VDDLLALARRVTANARGGEEIEVVVSRGHTTTARAYSGEVEELITAETHGIGVRVVVDGRQGFAAAGSLDASVVAETLADARDNARFGAPDPHVGLVAPDGVAAPALDLWRDELASFPSERKIALALELERATTTRDPRVSSVRRASYGDGVRELAIATTAGVEVAERASRSSLGVAALARDGDETQWGSGVHVTRDPNELDVEVAAAEAVARSTELLGATKAPTQRITVVFEPRMGSALLGLLASTLSGEAVLKGRSPFADRRGDRIAADAITFGDDPTDPRSNSAVSFDGEGLSTRRNVLVRDGVLCGFLHNGYTGRRSGEGSNAAAVRGYASTPGVGARSLRLEPGTRSFDELVRSIDRGFLVRSLSGLHSGTNPVSGDISVGADGIMIRGGALAEPVREITLASTLQRVLLDVVEVGADVEWTPGGAVLPTVVVADLALSGA